jgi:hypothetical protein
MAPRKNFGMVDTALERSSIRLSITSIGIFLDLVPEKFHQFEKHS